MKSFKKFLENYDVYLDKPMGFKKAEPEVESEEVTDTEDEKQEESEGGKGGGLWERVGKRNLKKF
jgi:hypothetical protein